MIWFAVLFALFVWWFSTGAILWLIGRRPGPATVWWCAPVGLAGLAALTWAGQLDGTTAAFTGFIGAIAVWGWLELAFLAGVITGPNTLPCPPGTRGWKHFLMAWGTVAHHELALLATLIGVVVATDGNPDQTGLWTFLILFFARISAKLNVYFGVPYFTHDLMPPHVAHMKTYFADRRMNLLFPVSITALTFAMACWIERAIAQPDAAAGFVILATLTALALLEHWLMVLPVRESALWKWASKKPKIAVPTTDPVDLRRNPNGL